MVSLSDRILQICQQLLQLSNRQETKGDLTIIPAELSGYYQAYNDDRYLQIRIPPYVMEQRIELAKRLLKKEDRAISDIALDCGFSSQSHLGQHFRKATGITPSEYRRN